MELIIGLRSGEKYINFVRLLRTEIARLSSDNSITFHPTQPNRAGNENVKLKYLKKHHLLVRAAVENTRYKMAELARTLPLDAEMAEAPAIPTLSDESRKRGLSTAIAAPAKPSLTSIENAGKRFKPAGGLAERLQMMKIAPAKPCMLITGYFTPDRSWAERVSTPSTAVATLSH